MKNKITILFFIFSSFYFFGCSNIEDNSNKNQIIKTCKLPSGQIVEDGFSGKDSGNNDCNQCYCTNGEYSCTEMACK